jgi:pyruvate/2-oxoglutarate dehydrogenase complex dihydrolipoamide acyltransferase (E2) component
MRDSDAIRYFLSSSPSGVLRRRVWKEGDTVDTTAVLITWSGNLNSE